MHKFKNLTKLIIDSFSILYTLYILIGDQQITVIVFLL